MLPGATVPADTVAVPMVTPPLGEGIIVLMEGGVAVLMEGGVAVLMEGGVAVLMEGGVAVLMEGLDAIIVTEPARSFHAMSGDQFWPKTPILKV